MYEIGSAAICVMRYAVKGSMRLAECHLEMHPTKTKIVYCKDGSRKGSYVNQASIFLETISKKSPDLFAHWQKGTIGAFA